jgi:hypothetical protein
MKSMDPFPEKKIKWHKIISTILKGWLHSINLTVLLWESRKRHQGVITYYICSFCMAKNGPIASVTDYHKCSILKQ